MHYPSLCEHMHLKTTHLAISAPRPHMQLWAAIWIIDVHCRVMTLVKPTSCWSRLFLPLGAVIRVDAKPKSMSSIMRPFLLLQLGVILVVGILDGKHGFNFSLLVRILSSLLLAWPIVMALAAGVVAT